MPKELNSCKLNSSCLNHILNSMYAHLVLYLASTAYTGRHHKINISFQSTCLCKVDIVCHFNQSSMSS